MCVNAGSHVASCPLYISLESLTGFALGHFYQEAACLYSIQQVPCCSNAPDSKLIDDVGSEFAQLINLKKSIHIQHLEPNLCMA